MEIKQVLCDPRNYRAQRRGFVEYIVVHYDGNDGATDEGNASYFANNDTGDTSAGYFVDEDSITRTVLDIDCAFHCGANTYKHPECRNDNSIGVEMCSDKDENGNYIITEATVANTIWLVKYLMKLYSLDVDHVLRHFDVTGKNCPAPWVENEDLWLDFKERIKEEVVVDNSWKDNLMAEARKEGLINSVHNPDDIATKWFVLGIALNLLKNIRKIIGGT